MIVIIIFLFFVILLSYMVYLAFENNVKEHKIVLEGVDEKVRLFFISDVHLRKINKKMIEGIQKPIHGVIIGGDLADNRTPIKVIRNNIQLLNMLGPVYFVWGNNDREVGEATLRKLLQEEKVTIIENDAVQMKNLQNFCVLVGIDDLTTGNPEVEKAFAKCCKEDNVFFICHDPRIFEEIQKEYKPKLLLGGHFHGGQIRLGPFGIFPKGLFKTKDGCTTLISNGYGTTAISLRFGARPECHIIDITFQSKRISNSTIESV